MNLSSKFLSGAIVLASLCLFQTAFAGAQKVIVNNSASNPVPVNVQNQVTTRSANEPALQPYVEHASATVNGSDSSQAFTFTVPTGKRLVIELVTIYAAVPAGQNVWGAGLGTTSTGLNPHNLTVLAQGQDDTGLARFAATHSIRTYSDAGNVSVTISRNASTGQWFAGATISGYLVDLPATSN